MLEIHEFCVLINIFDYQVFVAAVITCDVYSLFMVHKMYCFFCHFSLLKIFRMCGFYIAWSFLPWFYISIASFSHVVSVWIFLRGKIFCLRCICVQAIGSLTMIFYFCPFSVSHQHWPWPYDSLPLSVVTCQGQSQEKVMII